MLMTQTLDRLRGLRLLGMAEALHNQNQQAEVQGLSFEERIGLLVDHEWIYRQERRLKRLLSEAKLRIQTCPEDINYQHPRGLDRSVMRSLIASEWIGFRQNCLITGPTGTGKTFLACALAHAACRNDFTARYYRVPRLLSEILVAKADGSYPRLLAKLAKISLLVLDDWLLAPLNANEARELLEVIDDRTQNSSTLVASQLPVEHWHEAIADPTVADAVLDRLVHNSHRIPLWGDTMRKTTLNASKSVSKKDDGDV